MITNKPNTRGSDQKSSSPSRESQTVLYGTDQSKKAKSKIVIKYDVGFANSVYIRGKGANLSWDRGVPLKNVRADEWVWETDAPFSGCDFKVLINDQNYENGENHHLNYGSSITYTPNF